MRILRRSNDAMPFKSETRTARRIEWENYLVNALFLAAYGLVLAQFWLPKQIKSEWPDAALLVLAVAGTVVALTRHLPLQQILSASFLIALVGGAVTALDLETGIPFGQFTTSDNLGPKLFKALPWAMPLVWVVAILNSRGVARLVLRPWRKTRAYGFWLIGLTAVLTMLFNLAFDPFASRVKHYWFWQPMKFPLAWQGAPPVNFLGWLVVTLLVLAFVTPMLINKQPTHRRPPDFHPLGIWLAALLLFGTGSAVAGLWPAAVLDGIIGVVVALFTIRGARW